jgi:hypothetical protein
VDLEEKVLERLATSDKTHQKRGASTAANVAKLPEFLRKAYVMSVTETPRRGLFHSALQS